MDIENFDELLPYLRRTGRIIPDGKPAMSILGGGVSNRTVLVEPSGAPAFVLKQALEQLRVQTEWRSDPRRIEREALGLEHLAKLAPPGTTTRLLFLDRANHLLGMTAVAQPHVNWKTQLLAGIVNMAHVKQFAELIAAIHQNSRVESIARVFDDRTFFEALRLDPYYRSTAAKIPPARAFLNALIEDTWHYRLGLVHGDYSPKNVLIHGDQLVLLDHEVIHFGDCAFDLGFSLTHFLSKANHLREQREMFVAAARHYWDSYATHAPDLVESKGYQERVVRHTLGCLLARVEGKSPLEYLSASAKAGQCAIVSTLMPKAQERVSDLIDAFAAALAM